MSRERYFAESPMNWFRPGPDSRYSPYHWSEMKQQAQYAARLVLEGCGDLHNPYIGIVGFGFGRDTAILLDAFRSESKHHIVSVIGLDINPSRFPQAKREIGEAQFRESVRPLVASMNHVPFVADSLDATVCLETMVHADDPHATLTELLRITKPGGLTIVNLGLTQGRIRTALLVVKIEGLMRSAVRVKERIQHTSERYANRMSLYTPLQIQDIIARNHGVELLEQRSFLRGMAAFIVLRKKIPC